MTALFRRIERSLNAPREPSRAISMSEDSAQLSRAAKHLIETHGSRAAAVALKRAVYLHQCGQEAAANTWRRIADFARAIEAGKDPSALKIAADGSHSAISLWPRPLS